MWPWIWSRTGGQWVNDNTDPPRKRAVCIQTNLLVTGMTLELQSFLTLQWNHSYLFLYGAHTNLHSTGQSKYWSPQTAQSSWTQRRPWGAPIAPKSQFLVPIWGETKRRGRKKGWSESPESVCVCVCVSLPVYPPVQTGFLKFNASQSLARACLYAFAFLRLIFDTHVGAKKWRNRCCLCCTNTEIF